MQYSKTFKFSLSKTLELRNESASYIQEARSLRKQADEAQSSKERNKLNAKARRLEKKVEEIREKFKSGDYTPEPIDPNLILTDWHKRELKYLTATCTSFSEELGKGDVFSFISTGQWGFEKALEASAQANALRSVKFLFTEYSKDELDKLAANFEKAISKVQSIILRGRWIDSHSTSPIANLADSKQAKAMVWLNEHLTNLQDYLVTQSSDNLVSWSKTEE